MKKKYIIILITMLTIGFASVSATLVFNGKTNIGIEYDDFNVIFVEALLDGSVSDKASISEDKKTITFETKKLIEVNDTSRLDYKVKNISTQYNGNVTINCTNVKNEYIKVTSEFDGKNLPLISPVNISASEVKNGYIEVKLIKSVTEEKSIGITCTIDFEATSRDNYAYTAYFNSNGGSKVDDIIITLNEEYGELPIPTKAGYRFLGWYDEEDNKILASSQVQDKGNRTLYAKWESENYNIDIVYEYEDRSKTLVSTIDYSENKDVTIELEESEFITEASCTNGYKLSNVKTNIINLSTQTVNINNNNVANDSICTFKIIDSIHDYSYTGNSQTFTASLNGTYKIELWGAQGGCNDALLKNGGKGSYVGGLLKINKNTSLYVYVGEKPQWYKGGYNGGGNAYYDYEKDTNIFGGGGSTDISLLDKNWNDFDRLKSRIMVAAGGGGQTRKDIYSDSSGHGCYYGAAGGGLTGYTGCFNSGYKYGSVVGGDISYGGGGATQILGGTFGTGSSGVNATIGNFGIGGTGGSPRSGYTNYPGSGAGAGYYGGGGGGRGGFGGATNDGGHHGGSGGSGSSFISGHNGCDAIDKSSTSSNIIHTGQPNHYLGYIFTDTKMIDGTGYAWTNIKGSQEQMPNPSGGYYDLGSGHSGNGHARITLVSID